MVIDYSKWDNIDTDSEPETSSPPSKSNPRAVPMQPQAQAQAKAQSQSQSQSQPRASPAPPPLSDAPTSAAPEAAFPSSGSSTTASSTAGSVQAVIVRCEGEKKKFTPWSAVKIKEDHPIFSNSVPPIPALVEIPLVLHRVGTQSDRQAALDNQIATYLNIDSESGFAPPEWQSHVGTVVVARKDKKPLLPHHMEGVWMYCDLILDFLGRGSGAPVHLYNKQSFERWWNNYCKEARTYRPGTGGSNDPDDWRAVKSPYEI